MLFRVGQAITLTLLYLLISSIESAIVMRHLALSHALTAVLRLYVYVFCFAAINVMVIKVEKPSFRNAIFFHSSWRDLLLLVVLYKSSNMQGCRIAYSFMARHFYYLVALLQLS